MAVAITQGPTDWSISAENGRKWAEFTYGGHPTLGGAIRMKYKVTGTGELLGSDEEYMGACTATSGEHLMCDFGVGTWAVQFFVYNEPWRTHPTRSEDPEAEPYVEPEANSLLESSNVWRFEVTA